MKTLRAVVAAVLATAGLALGASPAAAGVGFSAVPDFPSGSTVGAAGQGGSLTITHVSSPPQSTQTATMSTITLVPACASLSPGGNCPGEDAQPGVFALSGSATGRAGTACEGMTFTVSTADAAQGKVGFTAAGAVTLGATGSATASCTIDFTFTTLKKPTKDASAQAGIQAAQLAFAQGSVGASQGTGAGTDLTTVNSATAQVVLQAAPGPVADSGEAVSVTATVLGVPNGPAPTGLVTFTSFFQDPTCAGGGSPAGIVALSAANPPTSPMSSTATSTSVIAAEPGTFRYRATYGGDVNYNPLAPTPCNEPGSAVTVVLTQGHYRPLTPARILDTRVGTGGPVGKIGPGDTRSVQITGQGGVPASGVAAVALNVTATEPTTDGYLTIFPSGDARPLAANLNFTPGKTVANLVVAKVGTGGQVELFNSAGSTHVIFDVAGWFSNSTAGLDGRYQALAPARIRDTRTGTGGPAVRLGPGASMNVVVAGAGGVPATGAIAAILNVAVTNATAATSFLTVHPAGEARPLAANLNWVAGNTVGNRVIAKLGAGGAVTIYNNSGLTDVIVDVNGWFTNGSVAGASGSFAPVVPNRVVDTRDGTGGISGARAAGSTVDVQISGRGGVPAAGATAVVVNVTVVSPNAAGYFTLFPAGTVKPLASDLNFASGEVRPNLVVVKIGAGGKVSLFTSAGAHVVIDVAGWAN